MQENKDTSRLLKIIVLLAGLILLALLTVGIVQTFIHNALLKKNEVLLTQNENILTNIEEIENEIDTRNSNEYLDDYLEQEYGYGSEGEVIVTSPQP